VQYLPLFLFIFAAISSTHIVVGSSIFGPLRKYLMDYEENSFVVKKFKDMILCYQCCGYWIGVVYSFIFSPFIFNFGFIEFLLFTFLVFGPINSLFSDLIYRLKQYICEECG